LLIRFFPSFLAFPSTTAPERTSPRLDICAGHARTLIYQPAKFFADGLRFCGKLSIAFVFREKKEKTQDSRSQ
jgi:hypothetical protein